MPFLITGGLGFIGSAVLRRLPATTDRVVVNIDDMTYAASPESLGEWLRHTRHAHVKADIRNVRAMRAAFATHRPSRVHETFGVRLQPWQEGMMRVLRALQAT